jgi:hypothetical protein
MSFENDLPVAGLARGNHSRGKLDPALPLNVAVAETATGDRSSFSQRLPFYLIGLLLLFTAIAKLGLLVTDPFADIRVGLAKEVLWLAALFEMFLVYINFCWRDRSAVAFIDTAVFSAFAIFAAIRILMGYQSCGCSGGLEIPAWVFLLIDIAIVAYFLRSQASRRAVSAGGKSLLNSWNATSSDRRGQLAGIGLFAFAVLLLQLPMANPLRAAILGSPQIIATVKVADSLQFGRTATGVVEISNQSGSPAKVIGLSRSCSCFNTVDDPFGVVIAANQSVVIPIEVEPKSRGPLHQRVVLFIDHPGQFRVNCDLFSEVKE